MHYTVLMVCRFLVLFGIVFVFGTSANAATLYMDPPTQTLNRGDAVTIALRLDTNEDENECVNAVDAVVKYDSSIIPVDVSIGQSILPVWVEQPKIDKEKNQITFAGGIPNGYCGRVSGDPRLTNVIAEIIFRSPGLQVGGGEDSNSANIFFDPQTKVYLNDGLGTVANLDTLGTALTLTNSLGGEIIDDWRTDVANDEIPPESFSISIEKDEYAFEKNYYIVFNTTDKQTGLSHYEVLEERSDEVGWFGFGAATAPWIEARSPYVLKDQSLRSTIRVRAIDKAGNEYVATIVPENVNKGFKIPLVYFYIFGGSLLMLILVIFLIRLKRRKNAVKKENEESLSEVI